MKRLTMLLVVLCVALPTISAQEIEIKYQDLIATESSELLQTVLDMQKIRAYSVTLKGENIKDKRYALKCHRVENGKVQDDMLQGMFKGTVRENDSLCLKFYAIPSGQDTVSLRIDCTAGKITLPIKKNSEEAILMETFLNKPLTVDEPIPIISLNAGEYFEVELPTGAKMTGRHYCPIRDEHIHPSLWTEKYKMDDYIYFEVKFE